MTTEQEITRWVVGSLKKENIRNPKITVTGYSGKGENYGGEITFVTARGNAENEEETKFDIVIKTGRRDNNFREEFNAKLIYEREVYLYNAVFPNFRNYQLSKRSKNIFNAAPKCYGTLLEKDVEILVLENLKSRRFQLHDRQVPMNVNHMKLVLFNYAKFHAISFVMRDQNPKLFSELALHLNPLMNLFLTDKMKELYKIMYNQNMSYVRQIDDSLSLKMEKFVGTSLADALLDMLRITSEDAIIVHGDSWNSNFMFRYEEGNLENPKEVAILDWQLSFVHSPVCDLSYFLYMVSSRENMHKIEELLQYYHDKLSFFITEMGTDPEKLFPYAKLLNHWEKYSIYGIAPVIVFLELIMCDEKDAPSLDSMDNFINVINTIKSKNEEDFRARLYGAIQHFCTWNRNLENLQL